MHDLSVPPIPAVEAPQRARGEMRIGFAARAGRTVLSELYQSGCLKARFPRPAPDGATTAVLLNTGGGVAGGDALRTEIRARPGTHPCLTTQAAERVYRARTADAPARIKTVLRVDDDAALDWLPQETILFNRAAGRRTLDIDLAATGRLIAVESLVLGRQAMGEQVRAASWHDLIRLCRDGRLVLHDAMRLEDPVAEQLAGRATAGGAVAVATLLYAGPGAEAKLDPLRRCLSGLEAGASAWDGLLIARILAADSARLRRAVMAGLAALRDDRPLPRIWHT